MSQAGSAKRSSPKKSFRPPAKCRRHDLVRNFRGWLAIVRHQMRGLIRVRICGEPCKRVCNPTNLAAQLEQLLGVQSFAVGCHGVPFSRRSAEKRPERGTINLHYGPLSALFSVRNGDKTSKTDRERYSKSRTQLRCRGDSRPWGFQHAIGSNNERRHWARSSICFQRLGSDGTIRPCACAVRIADCYPVGAAVDRNPTSSHSWSSCTRGASTP